MTYKRILSGILVLALLLCLFPTFVSAAPIALDEPEQTRYRFNGHAVTDRKSFALNAEDWTLGTFSDAPAIIRAGKTAGIGMEYIKDLPERWYGQISLKMSQEDHAGFVLSDGSKQLIVLAGSESTLTVCYGEETLLEQQLSGYDGKLTFVLDNTLDGQAFRLYVWHDGVYCGGWELTGVDSAMLQNVSSIGFYAEKEGDIFCDFGVNTMIYAYENDPAAALAQVETWARQEVVGSIVKADNGVNMYTPDGVKNYDALWTRDFTYMLRYAGDYIPVEDAVACIEYLLEHVHEGDCWLPDRVYGNGYATYAAGNWDYSKANLDNNSFIVIAMDCALSRMSEAEGRALFVKWEQTLMTALDALPKNEDGLVYNDPLNPHSPYGFTDCICKTGALMKESLLLWEAWKIMAKWQTAYGLDASVAMAGAQSIENALVKTFKNEDGMLNAATVDCCQSDIWGSCYAVSIGFPMEDSLKKSIADYLSENYCELVQMGQLRHTAPGTYWQKLLSGVNRGEYQNGAYWATPSGWLIDTLEPYYPALARETLQDIISYYAAEGIYECVNGEHRKLNHYAASASNILPAARRLLTVSPDLTELSISGDTAAVTGATKTYQAVLTPADAKIASYDWRLNGVKCGDAETLSYRFTQEGENVLSCTATDINGNAVTASLTVLVRKPSYPAITLTAGAISGDAGETVTVPLSISADSSLVALELTVPYDSSAMDFADAACEMAEVFSVNVTEPGVLRIVLANAEPLKDAGALLTLRFELKRQLDAPLFAIPVVDSGLCDYRDDSGCHEASITVTNEDVKPTEYTVIFVDGLTKETISAVKVEEGKAATAPEAPVHEGYTFKGWDKDFSKVTADLTVTAQYEKNEEEKPWVNRYTDVKESDWFYESVKFADQNGLFNGTSLTTFEPESDMTRAMLVTVLWRLDGKPAPKSANSFKDVPGGQWYTEPVAWAAENGIVNGVGDNKFDPEGNITREQMATILYRYAQFKGIDASKRGDLSVFPDGSKVEKWAKDAMQWTVAEKLIGGSDGMLLPQGSATRAQVATILMRYVENIVKK